MGLRAEHARHGQTDLSLSALLDQKLRAAAVTLQFDHIAGQRKYADHGKDARAAVRTAVGNRGFCIFQYHISFYLTLLFLTRPVISTTTEIIPAAAKMT